jgi:sigma-B regulation protein RsbU (phosphoserine phosphatase)
MNQFLSATARYLSSTDSVPVTLRRIARAAVPAMADCCLIFLAKDDALPCVASAHCTNDGRRLLRGLNRAYKITRSDPASTVAHVLRCGRPELRSDIVVEPHAASTDPHAFSLHRRLGARSALVVPIGTQRNRLGALSLCFTHSGRRYASEHLAAARQVADLIAAFIRKRSGDRSPMHVPVFNRRPVRLRARI